MKTSLTRNLAYWLLLALSVVSVGLGGWLVAKQIGSMSATPLDGTATVIDIYVAQSLVVIGAALLGAGLVGILLALTLGAAKSLLRPAAPVGVEPIHWSAPERASESAEDSAPDTASAEIAPPALADAEDTTTTAADDREDGAVAAEENPASDAAAEENPAITR